MGITNMQNTYKQIAKSILGIRNSHKRMYLSN